MIRVQTRPKVEPAWKLTLWAGEAFDYDAPLREVIDEVAASFSPPAEVVLPPRQADEDFISGELISKDFSLSIYFEYSLGYIEFGPGSKREVQSLFDRIKHKIVVGL